MKFFLDTANLDQIKEANNLGVLDGVTCPLKAILGLLKHPLTDIGLEKFLADYHKLNK